MLLQTSIPTNLLSLNITFIEDIFICNSLLEEATYSTHTLSLNGLLGTSAKLTVTCSSHDHHLIWIDKKKIALTKTSYFSSIYYHIYFKTWALFSTHTSVSVLLLLLLIWKQKHDVDVTTNDITFIQNFMKIGPKWKSNTYKNREHENPTSLLLPCSEKRVG